MTRQELDALWEQVYVGMVIFADKRLGYELGAEAVNDAYQHMVENETYKNQPKPGVAPNVWIWWKVKRDIERRYKKEQRQVLIKRRLRLRVLGLDIYELDEHGEEAPLKLGADDSPEGVDDTDSED